MNVAYEDFLEKPYVTIGTYGKHNIKLQLGYMKVSSLWIKANIKVIDNSIFFYGNYTYSEQSSTTYYTAPISNETKIYWLDKKGKYPINVIIEGIKPGSR